VGHVQGDQLLAPLKRGAGSDTAKKSASAFWMAVRTTRALAPWRRKTVACTSTTR